MNRRDFLRGAAGAGAGLALSGGTGAILTACGGGGGSKKSTKLEMWVFDANRADWQQKLLDQFMKNQGGKLESLTVTTVPSDQLYDKLQTAILAGTGAPDLVDLHIYLWTRFMKDDKLLAKFVNLTDMVGKEKENLVAGSAVDPWTWHSKIYGVCNELNPVLMYTRFDLFQKAGITGPIVDWEKDFIDKGKALKAKTGVNIISLNGTTFQDLYILGAQRGGTFFDEQGTFVGDQDVMVKTLQFMQDLVYTHQIAMVSPLDPAGRQGPPYYAAMQEGQFATAHGAPWFQGFMKANAKGVAGKWHIQKQPKWSDSQIESVTYGGTGMGILASTGNRDMAWEFVKYANLSNDGPLLAYKTHNLFPTYKPSWTNESLKQPDPYFDNQKPGDFITDAAGKMGPFRTSPFFSEVVADPNSIVARLAIQPVMQNKKKPKDAMADVVAEAKKIMGK